MNDKSINNSKSYYDKKYLTYNQIIKDYEVYILSEDEYNKLPKQQQKEVRYMILIKKSKSNPPEPKGPPAWALAIRNEIIALINQKIDEVNKRIDMVRQEVVKTNARLDNLVKKNNLRE